MVSETCDENAKSSANIKIDFAAKAALKDKPAINEKDVRRKIAEVANELWGRMGSLKIVINEVAATSDPLVFRMTFPANQRHKVGLLLFFINELNEQQVRMRIEENPTALIVN